MSIVTIDQLKTVATKKLVAGPQNKVYREKILAARTVIGAMVRLQEKPDSKIAMDVLAEFCIKYDVRIG